MHYSKLMILVITVGWLSACDKTSEPKDPAFDAPETKQVEASAEIELTLRRFIDVSIQRRHEDYYNLLSSRDQAIKSKADYLKEQSQLQPNLADAYFDKINYNIVAIKQNNNEARAEVLYHFPDVERMIKQVYNLQILNNQSLPPLDEMKQQLDAAYKNQPLPAKQVTRQFNLLKEAGQWRVHIGWDIK